MATWLNAVQQIAEGSRLGVPVLFVTNPRNHLGAPNTFGIAEASNAFSQWPGTLGLAAMRDTALVEEFARIAAQEYVSVGIRGAYHPTGAGGAGGPGATGRGFAGGGRPGGGNQPVDLTIPAARLTPIRTLMRKKPTVIVMQFDSPYVIP